MQRRHALLIIVPVGHVIHVGAGLCQTRDGLGVVEDRGAHDRREPLPILDLEIRLLRDGGVECREVPFRAATRIAGASSRAPFDSA